MRFTTKRGSEAPNAALTPDDVKEIRERRAAGQSVRKIARETAHNPQTVWRAANRYTYSEEES